MGKDRFKRACPKDAYPGNITPYQKNLAKIMHFYCEN